MERQNWRCAKYGETLRGRRYLIDHKKPLALGGSNSIRNLQALCPECHHVKTIEDMKKIVRARRRGGESVFTFGPGSSSGKRKKRSLFTIEIPEISIPDLLGGKEKRGKKREKSKFDIDLF